MKCVNDIIRGKFSASLTTLDNAHKCNYGHDNEKKDFLGQFLQQKMLKKYFFMIFATKNKGTDSFVRFCINLCWPLA
jgi:hypothetical protein